MNLSLAPIVLQRLSQFRRRRHRLIVLRSLCVGVVTFIVGIAVAAAIDYRVLLSDTQRWVLSGVVYLAAAVATAVSLLSRLRSSGSDAEEAAQVEAGSDDLRERLRSAVELASDDPDAIHDSPVFRSLLQRDVAERVEQVRVRRLLPLRMIAAWLAGAFVVVAAAVAVLTLGGEPVRHLAMRTAFPAANLARLSRVQVRIVKPSPTEQLLPRGEPVAVVVEITDDRLSGRTVERAILETEVTQSGSITSDRTPLAAEGDGQFAANLPLDAEMVRYRVRAGDAVTRWHRLKTQPRPHVQTWTLTLTPPAYAEMSPFTMESPDGSFAALAGSRAEVAIILDQPVAGATATWVADEDERSLPLVPTDDSRKAFRVSVPVESDGAYRLHFVGAATGFDNRFAAASSVRAIADRAPQVQWPSDLDVDEPTIVTAASTVSLDAVVYDDLAVDRIVRSASINNGSWSVAAAAFKRLPAADEDGGPEWLRDGPPRPQSLIADSVLFESLGATGGDQVRIKIVATDRRGQVGESTPRLFLVAEEELAVDRHAATLAKLAIVRRLQPLARRTRTVVEASRSQNDRGDQGDAAGSPATARLFDDFAAVRLATNETIAELPGGADADDLELVAAVLATIELRLTRGFAADDEGRRRDDLDFAIDAVERLAKESRTLASHNVGMSALADLIAIGRQQQTVAAAIDRSEENWALQQQITLRQLDQLESFIAKTDGLTPRQTEKLLAETTKWSQRVDERVAEEAARIDQPHRAVQLARDVAREVRDRQRRDLVVGSQPREMIQSRERLTDRIATAAEVVKALSEGIDENTEGAAADGRTVRDWFAARESASRSRPDADVPFADDINLASRAIGNVLSRRGEWLTQETQDNEGRFGEKSAAVWAASPAEAIEEIGEASDQLALLHELRQSLIAIRAIRSLERWDTASLDAQLDRPRQWEAATERLERIRKRARKAGFPNEYEQWHNTMRWSQAAQAAAQRLNERRWRPDDAKPTVGELGSFESDLSELIVSLAPTERHARATLRKYVPTLQALLEQLGSEVRSLQAETETLEATQNDAASPDTQRSEIEPSQERVDAVIERQRQTNERLADALDELARDANARDLLDDADRQLARDADISRELLRSEAERMNRELDEAIAAATEASEAGSADGAAEAAEADRRNDASDRDDASPVAENAIREAIEAERNLAEAIELVAEHFADSDRESDADARTTETGDRLQEREAELGIDRELDKRFDQADELAERTRQTPEELRVELEAELPRNPAMQDALDQIAESTAAEAAAALAEAAARERQIRKANERADDDTQSDVRQQAAALRAVGDRAAAAEQNTVREAAREAARSLDKKVAEPVEQSRQTLAEATQAARSVGDHTLRDDIAAEANRLAESLRETAETMEAAAREARERSNDAVHETEAEQNRARQDMQRQLQRVRDRRQRAAADQVRRRQSETNQARNRANQAKQRAEQAERRLQDAINRQRQKPDDQSRERRVEQDRRQAAEAIAEQERADAEHDAAKAREQSAREIQQQANRKQTPTLTARNPAAEVAAILAEQAAAETRAVAEAAEAIAEDAGQQRPLRPDADQLAWAAREQAEIGEQIAQTEANIERAALHEERLENAAQADSLRSLGKQVAKRARPASEAAEASVADAEQSAREAEDGGQEAAADAAARSSQSNAAASAQQSLAAAEQALSDAAAAAESLGQADDASGNQPGASGEQTDTPAGPNASQGQSPTSSANVSEPSSSNGSPTGQEPTAEAVAEGRQLAETLDRLDRQLAAAGTAGSSPSQSTEAGNESALASAGDSGPSSSGRPQQPGAPLESPPATADDLRALFESQAAAAQRSMAAARQLEMQSSRQSLTQPLPPPLGDQTETAISDREAGSPGELPYGAVGDPLDRFSPPPASAGEYAVDQVDRSGDDWGALRERETRDAVGGDRRAVPEEYRKSVDAYFRELAKRANDGGR